MRLTAADLRGRKTTGAVHVDYTRSASAWIYGLEGIPRLKICDAHSREAGFVRTWLVDGKACRDLNAALAMLNGEMSIEEATAMAESAPLQRPKKSLAAQIAEVDYELEQRADVYKRIASNNPQRKSELELHVETMKAVRETLIWLQENELIIKQRMAP
jgi:hypothetical protein